ncbi:MAG: M14 family metallopeptidase [Oscillospiraceae bacterium]|nr:M14 family metallopeptidase [Oscillospiraceae bacterium]
MRNFQPGAKHPDIDFFQLGLTRAGYEPGAVDGIFGSGTGAALEQFRRDRGITGGPDLTEADWRALGPFLVGYVRHTVQAGDTMAELAPRFRTTVEAIAAANPGIRPEHLQIGQRLVIPLGFPVVPTNVRFTSNVLRYVLQGLTARHPLIRRESLGQSVWGQELAVLRFGEGPRQISYNAAHHGNEWITTPVLLKFLEEYAIAYADSGTIGGMAARPLFDASTLHLVPMVNPDGVDIATGAADVGANYEYATYLTESYPSIPFPTGWKANARGVDLNLQYPAGWERAKEIKFGQGVRFPGPRDYVGTAPLSEPESRALYDYTLAHDFRLTMSYHSQGQIIYWQYLDYLPEGSREIGETLSALSGYALEETPYESGHAGYKDWFIQHANRPGYTIEVGLGESPLPLNQFDQIYRDNVGMLAVGLVIEG